jgi:Zn-finger nucleic acid-binding protein
MPEITQRRRYVPSCELSLPASSDDRCGVHGTEYWRGLDVCPRCKGIAELEKVFAAGTAS